MSKQIFGTILLFFLYAYGIHSPPAFATEGGGGSGVSGEYYRRAQARETKRWTLTEWLEQRDRNRMMDLWLSLNSPSPYELSLEFGQNSYTKTIEDNLVSGSSSSTKFVSYRGDFSAYAQIFGLTFIHENNADEHFNDTLGIFNLRLFGHCIQCTSLTLHYGLRTRYLGGYDPLLRLSQQFLQGSIQLYLHKYFGLDAIYRNFEPVTEALYLGNVSENLSEFGAFIDYGGLRIFGRWFTEKITYAPSSSTRRDEITTKIGIRSGIRIFF